MNTQMKSEARHILMNYLIKGHSTAYGLNHKTSVTTTIAKLRKNGYVEVTGRLTLSTQNISTNPPLDIDYFYVKPTQKLLDIKNDLILNKASLEKVILERTTLIA